MHNNWQVDVEKHCYINTVGGCKALLSRLFAVGYFLVAGQTVGISQTPPPVFNSYAGPKIVFAGNPVEFSVSAQTFQPCGCQADITYELLSAPTNVVGWGDIFGNPPCEKFFYVFAGNNSRSTIGTTNVFVFRATDPICPPPATPPLSATTSVSFVVIDVPPIHSITVSNGMTWLQFTNPFSFYSSQYYEIDSCTNLSQTNWSLVKFINSSSPVITVIDTNAITTRRFYRLLPSSGWTWGFVP